LIRGTQGYSDEADEFIKRSEAIPFAEKHRHVLHLFRGDPCDILDIGAGTGADAAFFADQGHRILAVEPTDELRVAAMQLHRSDQIEWGNDSLPELTWTLKRGQQFDLVLISAVWMHLDESERQRAMPNVASMIRAGGILIMSLRHGPVPSTKQMFDVSADETINLGESLGMRCVLNVEAESIQSANRLAGVTWSHLAFQRF